MTDADDISAPAHLTAEHDLAAFDSGIPALDDWLKRRALDNEKAGASRTYVVTAGGRVVGYPALANGAVAQSEAPGRVRRNMPDQVPVMFLGASPLTRPIRTGVLARVSCAMPFSARSRPRRSLASRRFWCTRSPRTPSASPCATDSSNHRWPR